MPRYIPICALSDLPPGGHKSVELEGRLFAAFNHDGKIYVIDGLCPHRGGTLGEGGVDAQGIVTCPWHGWRFDVCTGKSPVNPAARVPVYNVRIENGQVEAEI